MEENNSLIEDGIFANKDDVVDNLKSAAENVGISTEAFKPLEDGEPKKVYYSRKNCTWCCGRGMLDFVPNGIHIPSRRKDPSEAYLRAVKMTRYKLGRNIQKLQSLTNGSAKPGRNTCLPEDWKNGEWRENNMTKVLCKCVRIVEEE